jgi:hypothetical protein
MTILKSYRNKNNKLTKKSRRLNNKNRLIFKNGGGKQEDLIKQIVNITDQIYCIERACAYGSAWCNAPGPNPEVDALDKQRLTLIDEYKSEFPMQDLDHAIAQRAIDRREEEERPERERRAKEAEERRLKHIQWEKERVAEEKVRLQREFDRSIASYKQRIQRVPKDESSLENERADLELWYDNLVKSCSNQESCDRLRHLYNEKKKILQSHFPPRPAAAAAAISRISAAGPMRAVKQTREQILDKLELKK